MNWFLYNVTENFLDDDGELVKKGEKGVGQCSMSPGILEAPYGTMYVVTGEYVKKFLDERNKRLNARTVTEAIEFYYYGKDEEKVEYEFVFD